MSCRKGKKELGIYYAKTLVSVAEEISEIETASGKATIQNIFYALQKRGRKVRKNMTYLVTHWVYQLSMFEPWEEKSFGRLIWRKKLFRVRLYSQSVVKK